MNHDRIAEVYEGTFGSAEFQELSRRRVHWMCSQAAGNDILDVGCSQGIASILLGREGRNVVGIDRERVAIEAARERIMQEEDEVQRRVSFEIGEAARLRYPDDSFDALLMGELLEHLIDREGPLIEARRVLRPGGRLIVTTPYGILPYPDHKDPVYQRELLTSLRDASFAVEGVELIGRYLGVVASAAGPHEKQAHAGLMESALTVAEQRLADQDARVEELSGALAELQKRERDLSAAVASANKKGTREAFVRERLEATLETTETHERKLEEDLRKAVAERDIANVRLTALEQASGDAESAAASARDRVEQLKASTAELEERLRREEREVVELRERVRQQRAQQQQLNDAQAQIRRLTAERDREADSARRYSEQVEDLRARAAEGEDAAERERTNAARLSQQVESLRDRLDALAAERDHHRLVSSRARKRTRQREVQLAQARAELGDQQAMLQRERDRVEQAMAMREQLAVEFGEARQRLSEERERASALQSKLESVAAAERAAASTSADLEASVASLSRRLEHEQARKSEEIQGLTGEVQRLSQEAQRLSEEARASMAELGSASRRAELAESRAKVAESRALRFEQALTAIRVSRAYRIMRVLWAVRRKLGRAPRSSPELASGGHEGDEEGSLESPRGPRVLSLPTPRPEADSDVRQLRVAAILDDMSRRCFEPECTLSRIDSTEVGAALDDAEPDLLLVESAWSGNSGQWKHLVASYQRGDLVGLPRLRELIQACHERDIQTVFWNKEDPVHFDRFREAASLFDHVLTTDANCVERYEQLAGPLSIGVLPFAAQPTLHNPRTSVGSRSYSPCFAGTFYRTRHEERQRSLETLLDAARPFGLAIYDRTFGSDDPAFGFADRFQPHVLGSLPYERVVQAYKEHRLFLNANSVIDSPTMCSRRVFELLACDTAILSTPARALTEFFGDLVPVAETIEGATTILERFLGSDAALRELTRTARREVFARHTYRHRLAQIADIVGVEAPQSDGAVSALAMINGPEELERLRAMLSSQRNAPDEMILGVPDDAGLVPSDLNAGRVEVVHVDTTSADAWPELAAHASKAWLALIDPKSDYGDHHLSDLLTTSTFAQAQVIGVVPQSAREVPVQQQPVKAVHPASALVRRAVLAERGWPSMSDWRALMEWSADGVRIYAADADGFRPGNGKGRPAAVAIAPDMP